MLFLLVSALCLLTQESDRVLINIDLLNKDGKVVRPVYRTSGNSANGPWNQGLDKFVISSLFENSCRSKLSRRDLEHVVPCWRRKESKRERERVKDASSFFQGLGSAFTQIPNKDRQSVHLELVPKNYRVHLPSANIYISKGIPIAFSLSLSLSDV